MGRILSFLIPLLLSFPAYGESLVHYIGWSMSKIEQEAPVEEGTYTTRPDFYSLKPPGDRPAISIDARTASALRSGQADPESIYSRSAKTGGETASSSDEEYVYGASNSQIVQAEPVESTLPSDQRSSASQVITASSSAQEEPTRDTKPGFSNVITAPSLPRPVSTPGFTPRKPSGGNAPDFAGTTAASVLPGNVDSTPAAGKPLPVRPGLPETAETDRQLASALAEAQASNVPGLTAGKAAEDGKVAEASQGGGSRVTANQQPQGFGFGSGATVKQNKSPEEQREEPPPPCVPGKKIFEKPGLERIDLPPGCNLVYVTAWGAGGGNGGGSGSGQRFYGGDDGGYQNYEARPGVGGAGAFVNVTGKVDARRYDLIIAVGAAGASAKGSQAGLGGFPGGGTGGESSHAAGGGGGGYSGAFLIDKTNKTKSTKAENAVAIAAGGGGGGGRGGNGAPGRADGTGGKSGNGEAGEKLLGGHGGGGLPYPGCENSQKRCMLQDNSGEGYSTYEVARDHMSAGGGGGGGGFEGGGGGAGARSGGNTGGGGGGSSLAKLENQITEAGEGTKAGFYHYPARGNAGNAGQHGKVIVEYY